MLVNDIIICYIHFPTHSKKKKKKKEKKKKNRNHTKVQRLGAIERSSCDIYTPFEGKDNYFSVRYKGE